MSSGKTKTLSHDPAESSKKASGAPVSAQDTLQSWCWTALLSPEDLPTCRAVSVARQLLRCFPASCRLASPSHHRTVRTNGRKGSHVDTDLDDLLTRARTRMSTVLRCPCQAAHKLSTIDESPTAPEAALASCCLRLRSRPRSPD